MARRSGVVHSAGNLAPQRDFSGKSKKAIQVKWEESLEPGRIGKLE
jgi:hypothetical protein